jgi:hypothetical protein
VDERSGETAGAGERRLERAIVLVLVSDEPDRRWPYERLAAELDVEAEPLARALERLSRLGVVCVGEETVWASAAVRHIDDLGLIGI